MNEKVCTECQTVNHLDELVCSVCGSMFEMIPLSKDKARSFSNDHLPALAWGPRMFSAVWFAGTALVPLLFLTGFTGLGNTSGGGDSFFLIGIPILLAATAGFSVGARILDRSTTRSGFGAVWKGVLTAGLSFIVYLVLLSVVAGFTAYSAIRESGELLNAVAGVFVLYLYYGSMILGWIVLISGALSGALLHAFSSLAVAPAANSERAGGPGKGLVALISFVFVLATCIVPVAVNVVMIRSQQAESLREFKEMQRLHSVTDSDIEFLRSKLAEGADPNFPERPSGPLLEAAAINEQKGVVRLLLEYGADPNRTSKYGWPPFVSAARFSDTQMMRDLIRAGADVNQGANDGSTALINASLNMNFEGVEILLKNGTNMNARNSEGKTALGCVQERKEKYFTNRTDTSPQIEAESKALDNMIALLKKNGGEE